MNLTHGANALFPCGFWYVGTSHGESRGILTRHVDAQNHMCSNVIILPIGILGLEPSW